MEHTAAHSLIVVVVDVVVHAFWHDALLLVAALEALRWGHEGEPLLVVVAAGSLLVRVRVRVRFGFGFGFGLGLSWGQG